jgi:hypothetical protein
VRKKKKKKESGDKSPGSLLKKDGEGVAGKRERM